jgi:nuclear distribution protein NudE
METRTFSSIEEECHYWKELSKLYRKEKLDCQKEFEDFTEESRQLEQELETTLIQNEKQLRDANQTIDSLRDENQSLRQRLTSYERDATAYETKLNQLLAERDSLKNYIRELEQKNDDLERTNRVVSESVAGFEAMLNQAYEKNAMLEMEIDEKEQLQINLQRLMDEARDLKQELKIRNISLPTKLNNEVIDKNKSMTASKSNITMETSVSKMNDINDSRNNNSLSLNASMDKTTSTFNNTSMMDTTIHNMSCGTTTTTESLSPKSQIDSGINKSTQNSVLKYDCTINNNNPIAASTRVSALNIVADLLKKLDNLEAKLKSWKTQKSPSQRFIEATASFNNNENSCSIENLDRK